MNKIILFVIMITISFLSTIIFMTLDYRYNIRIKYFSFVAKNRLLFSIVIIMWLAILIGIVTNCNNYFTFSILILYYTTFVNLYHRISNWKFAYDVYIKNVDLLLKAKEKEKNKRKRKK